MKTLHFLSGGALKKLKPAELSRYMSWLESQKEKNLSRAQNCQRVINAQDDLSVRTRESRQRGVEAEQIAAIRKKLHK